MASQVELTPCGAMFDIFKRAAHLSHIELCGLVLSSRPLADGRSPQSRGGDRRNGTAPRRPRGPSPPIALGFPALSFARRSARFSSATLPNTVPRLRVLCRNWPCASEIPWTPRL